MAQHTSELNGSVPWWGRILERYGLATLLAIVFVWFLVQVVTVKLDGMQAALERHMEDTSQALHQLTWYSRALCLNSADDEAQRLSCLLPQERQR